jgi:hypothetical protein
MEVYSNAVAYIMPFTVWMVSNICLSFEDFPASVSDFMVGNWLN